MALYPLFHHHQSPAQAVIHAAHAIRAHEDDIIRKADLLTVLALFGKLATPGFDPLNAIGREAMKESPLYQEIVEEGELKGARLAVLKALAIRFGKIEANTFGKPLGTIGELGDLWELHECAMKSRTITGFRKFLARKLKSQPTS